MNSLVPFIWAAGAAQLAIAAANFSLPARLRYRENAARMSPILQQISVVHWVYIAGVLVIFSGLCFFFAPQLASGSPLGRYLSATLAIFWLSRCVVQLFYYDKDLPAAESARRCDLSADFLLYGRRFCGGDDWGSAMTGKLLSTALWLAGLGHFCVLGASFQVPARLGWKTDLVKLSPFNRKLMWTHGGFAVLTIVAFGVLTLTLHSEMLRGDRAALGLAGFIGVYWSARVAVNALYYRHSDWPIGVGFVVGHALLTGLFVALAATYLGLVARTLIA